MYIFFNNILHRENFGFSLETGEEMAMIESNRRYIRRCADNIISDFKEGKWYSIKQLAIPIPQTVSIKTINSPNGGLRIRTFKFKLNL